MPDPTLPYPIHESVHKIRSTFVKYNILEEDSSSGTYHSTIGKSERDELLLLIKGMLYDEDEIREATTREDVWSEKLGVITREPNTTVSLDLHLDPNVTDDEVYDLFLKLYYMRDPMIEEFRQMIIYSLGLSVKQFKQMLVRLSNDPTHENIFEEFKTVNSIDREDIWEMQETKPSMNRVQFHRTIAKHFELSRTTSDDPKERSMSKKRTKDGDYYHYLDDRKLIVFRDNLWQENDLGLEFIEEEMKRCKINTTPSLNIPNKPINLF